MFNLKFNLSKTFFFLLEKKTKEIVQKKNTNLNQIECICDIRTGIATILKTKAGK